jgi:hypothetical protein
VEHNIIKFSGGRLLTLLPNIRLPSVDLASDKHSSLFNSCIKDEEDKFDNIIDKDEHSSLFSLQAVTKKERFEMLTPGANVIKLFCQ